MSSLQNMCLSLIAENFERFHIAFQHLNNEDLKLSFEFLQRKYSSELASELFVRGILTDQYLEFVINKHLKFLDETWLMDTRYSYSMKNIFRRLTKLAKLCCILRDNEILKNVAKFCPEIVEINCGSFVTDRGIEYLCKRVNGYVPCPKLKKLCIHTSAGVTDKCVENLIRNLKFLEQLDHKSVLFVLYSLHKEDLPKLENTPRYNLIELKLDYDLCRKLWYYYSDALKICLTVCPKLKSLSCVILDKEQLDLFSNTSLQDLSITFTNQNINIDDFLKKCGCKLISFDVVNCIISLSKLASNCPKLERLKTNDVTFLDDHGDSEVIFHSLAKITLYERENKKISDCTINLLLLSSPSLEEIEFMYCDLSPRMKSDILQCCEKFLLKTITFYECINVEINFLKNILLSCPSLKILNISTCSFADYYELKLFPETLPNKPEFHAVFWE